MADFFANAAPYLLLGVVIYLIFRAVIWLLYYKGEMRVPLWHEVGFVLLGLWLLVLCANTLSPALGFSFKPSVKGSCFLPIKGTIELVKAGGFSAILGAVFRYIPLGFLIPFLFRRYQNFLKTVILCGGISIFTEVVQLFLSGASTNIDEVIWNLIGTFVGYFLYALLHYYLPEVGSMGTVKRSRRRDVPFVVKKELEFLAILMLVAVIGKGTQLEVVRVKAEKAAQEEQERKEEEARKAAEEAEAQRLAEEEAKKLKTSDTMLSVSVEAQSACLFSIEEDLIVYEKNGQQRVAPASTTKLLTALTVLNYCSLDETVTAGEEIGLVSDGATTASLKLGTRGTLETFLGAMLVPSGNDAAYVLANHAGHKILGDDNATTTDAVAAFMQAMNEYAAELDLENSNFVNPDGDAADNHYTTAYDLVRIARECLKNETIMDLCGRAKYRALFENMDVTYRNSNLLLQSDSEYYYEGALGLKTGSTSDTKNLVGAIQVNGMRYVSVVLQDSEEGRWKDTHTLFHALKGDTGAEDTPEE